VHDTFRAYAAQFRVLLGIPGDGALEVFNQAIGVKEVDDVNRFVRRHLLDPGEALKFVQETLGPLYKELLACWERIQRAERQIEQLRPIAAAQKSADDARAKLKDLARQLSMARPYYHETERKLRQTLREELVRQKDDLTAAKSRETTNQKTDNDTRDQLRAEIDAGELGLRLKALDLSITAAKTTTAARETAAGQLSGVLKTLNEPTTVADAERLAALKKHWGAQRTLVENNRAAQQEKQLRHLQERQGHQDELKRLGAAERSLKEHRVNIDDDYLQLRALVAQEAKIPMTVLSFAGELIEVRAEFREWTGAIERLLRGFGLSLLVPERHISAVYPVINRKHWGMRIQLFRVPADAPRDIPAPRGQRVVADRLTFRDKHPLAGWVAAEVRRAFPHVPTRRRSKTNLMVSPRRD
jgi:uncharacterized protein YPO0396